MQGALPSLFTRFVFWWNLCAKIYLNLFTKTFYPSSVTIWTDHFLTHHIYERAMVVFLNVYTHSTDNYFEYTTRSAKCFAYVYGHTLSSGDGGILPTAILYSDSGRFPHCQNLITAVGYTK